MTAQRRHDSDCDSGCRWFEPHQPPHIFNQLGMLWHSS
uniref:Uncharacterized protein n=1 Tax=mine drainage metagenome TaxID=410659 RepID=E6QG32_9ZZZZ